MFVVLFEVTLRLSMNVVLLLIGLEGYFVYGPKAPSLCIKKWWGNGFISIKGLWKDISKPIVIFNIYSP